MRITEIINMPAVLLKLNWYNRKYQSQETNTKINMNLKTKINQSNHYNLILAVVLWINFQLDVILGKIIVRKINRNMREIVNKFRI